MEFSEAFWQQRGQIRNVHRVVPLEVFIRLVREANPLFCNNEYNFENCPINYMHGLLIADIYLSSSREPRETGFCSLNESRARIEAFLLTYFNLWSAEDENTLQRAFYQYEQLVRLDFKEICLTVIYNMLKDDFPRNLSFMQMHKMKHLSSSKLWKSYIYKGREKIPYYFLHPDLNFTWVPTVLQRLATDKPLYLFLTENKLFHYETIETDLPFKTYIGERSISTIQEGYKYSYVLEGTVQNKRLIDAVVAEQVDRAVSIMKPSFETFIRELRYRFFSEDNLNGIPKSDYNFPKGEQQFQFADPAWKAQSDTLSKIEAALGNDFNLFYNDASVQKHLPQLLNNPNLTPYLIRNALKKWRKIGSPTHVSPFVELIKSLLG